MLQLMFNPGLTLTSFRITRPSKRECRFTSCTELTCLIYFLLWKVHWPRSPDIQLAALHYALLNENHEAMKLLLSELHNHTSESRRHNEPTVSLDRMDTGT